MSDPIDDLAGIWRWIGETQFQGYSPTYERIAEVVVDDREVLAILSEAPPAVHFPPAPLAAVRYLLLDGTDHPLGAVYDGTSDADPGPLFADFVRAHRDPMLDLLQTRRVQTNDCGRSALIGPALTWVAARWPGSHAMVDVGTSAGINLRCDEYRLDYGGHGATGPEDSPVHVRCEVKGGDPPIADRLPPLVERVGVDLSPIDLTDPTDARWLLACVWPDTGRAERVEASIGVVQADPPRIVAGRANDVIVDVLDALGPDTTAIVTTTWAFGYFAEDERAEFTHLLAEASTRRPVLWISSEGSGAVAEVPPASDDAWDVLGVLHFDGGPPSAHRLADVHPHGHWIDWQQPA